MKYEFWKFNRIKTIVPLFAVILLLAAGCSKQTNTYSTPPNEVVQPSSLQAEPARGVQTQDSNINVKVPAVENKPQAVEVAPNTNYVKYQGVEGKNALALLKEKYKVEVKTFSGVGEFVESIEGVLPDSKHFWAFYVNGQSSTVGAGSYTTKSTDVLEWKLEEIK